MNQTATVSAQGQAVFEIIGFDRVQFVSDVLEAASIPGRCSIGRASFEADGIRATGRLTVQAEDRQQLAQIDYRLRIVRGLVRVTQLSNTP